MVNVGRYRPAVFSDPYTALLRDSIADGPSAKVPYTEKNMTSVADHQLQALEQLALQQRWAHQHMVNILKEAEIKHRKVIINPMFLFPFMHGISKVVSERNFLFFKTFIKIMLYFPPILSFELKVFKLFT